MWPNVRFIVTVRQHRFAIISYLLVPLEDIVGLDLLGRVCILDSLQSLNVFDKVAFQRSIDWGIVYRYKSFYKLGGA